MSDIKIVAASIVNFLKRQLEGDSLSVDSRESVEVGVQCIETAFELSPEDAARGLDLLQLVRAQTRAAPLNAPPTRSEAEKLKNEGNEFMKSDRHREALEKYTRAIELDPSNPVYFCNRAAAHFKLGENEAAVADCTAALGLQPDYGKAHSRLGLALTALERHREARAAYARAAQLEPDNESYRQNLRLADEQLAAHGERAPLDLGGLLQNPALLNMATEMLADPNMQNLISGLMSGGGGGGAAGAGGPAAAGGMSALLEAGQALAQHMQAANPELVEQLRRQVRPPGPSPPQ
ncbi:small glutamine-rich tetratricopeptide repeat-containing protein beta [Helicoverpa armigera]|uniref:small glutamine-rich tetratricopeptide repeat-containing protein beta-like n=1 Tax=Helicoverpa zea TaxID=7113 RepID=UPI001F57C628|nr:small glutamine-rich tetratricopeptide repeat-containing protein beta-like [Helicoverpa zea]XP_049693619.1 small glutamine-rich tetratricopeptide repeat-containing protein beta-like [Helicoverpa armigera]